jgi:hypothetical protein
VEGVKHHTSALLNTALNAVTDCAARVRSSAASVTVTETCTNSTVQGNQPAEHHKSCCSRYPAVEDIKDMPNTLTKETVSNV